MASQFTVQHYLFIEDFWGKALGEEHIQATVTHLLDKYGKGFNVWFVVQTEQAIIINKRVMTVPNHDGPIWTGGLLEIQSSQGGSKYAK